MVTPGEIQASTSFPRIIRGPVIVASTSDGDTSGRETVVAVAKRFFPHLMPEYIQSVESYDRSIGWPPISAEPFAPDPVHRVTNRIVEFVTPANQEGYGTWEKVLTPSLWPIRGIVSVPEDGALLEVLVRIAPNDDTLANAIFRAEEICLQKGNGCLADDGGS